MQWSTIESNLRLGSRQAGRGGYTLHVAREVRCIFSRSLKVANVLDSLIAAGNLFQMVAAEKLKECQTEIISAGRNT